MQIKQQHQQMNARKSIFLIVKIKIGTTISTNIKCSYLDYFKKNQVRVY